MKNAEKIINLTFRRRDFEDIYFKNSQGNIFLDTGIKKSFLIFLVFIIISCVLLVYSISTDKYIFLTVISFLCLLITGFMYCRQAIYIWNWKQKINSFLNELSHIKIHKITLTAYTISLEQDDEKTIEKWSAITKITMSEDYISLKGTQDYLFPKKSMSEIEFNYLADFASEKIKAGV